jgi:thiamine-phosphate pyrophosphorylase
LHPAPRTPHLARLYAVLDVSLSAARGLDPERVLDIWLDQGVRLVQLRAKDLGSGAFLSLAERLSARARAAGAMFIVNDRADLARLAGAAGVHVGQDDLPPRAARRLVGRDGVIGCSTHNESQVRRACREPIDYLAVGPIYATRTKRGARDRPIGLSGIRRAVDRATRAGLPVVAIGGITRNRVAEVLDAGAASVAVISGLMTGDVRRAVRAYLTAAGAVRV